VHRGVYQPAPRLEEERPVERGGPAWALRAPYCGSIRLWWLPKSMLCSKRSGCDTHRLTTEGGAGLQGDKRYSEHGGVSPAPPAIGPSYGERSNCKCRITMCEHKCPPKRRKVTCLLLVSHSTWGRRTLQSGY